MLCNNSGYVIKCLLFLPAAGYRRNDNGQLNNRGNGGYYWSTTQSGGNGYGMWFNNGNNVNAGALSNPANGFSVRCVAELKKRINLISRMCIGLQCENRR